MCSVFSCGVMDCGGVNINIEGRSGQFSIEFSNDLPREDEWEEYTGMDYNSSFSCSTLLDYL